MSGLVSLLVGHCVRLRLRSCPPFLLVTVSVLSPFSLPSCWSLCPPRPFCLPLSPVLSPFLWVTINEGRAALAIKKIKKSELISFSAKDLRVLPVLFDPQGDRKRDFAEAVTAMSQDKVPGGELQLEATHITGGIESFVPKVIGPGD